MPVCICSTLPTYMRRRSYLGEKSEHRGDKCSTTGLRVIRNLAWLHNIKDTSARLCSLVKRPDLSHHCNIVSLFFVSCSKTTDRQKMIVINVIQVLRYFLAYFSISYSNTLIAINLIPHCMLHMSNYVACPASLYPIFVRQTHGRLTGQYKHYAYYA